MQKECEAGQRHCTNAATAAHSPPGATCNRLNSGLSARGQPVSLSVCALATRSSCSSARCELTNLHTTCRICSVILEILEDSISIQYCVLTLKSSQQNETTARPGGTLGYSGRILYQDISIRILLVCNTQQGHRSLIINNNTPSDPW